MEKHPPRRQIIRQKPNISFEPGVALGVPGASAAAGRVDGAAGEPAWSAAALGEAVDTAGA
ncbi:MAG TPA: hypothetical protein VG651_14930 [Stellaceae bacterium]|nr:hypothetical protein [Stellaceae bacterium]